MKKITVHEPIIMAQSTTEPILFGGYQDPDIRCSEGVLYVRFNSRRDCPETFGLEDKNPVYKSFDEGKTWERSNHFEWSMAVNPLPNGDRITIREPSIITDFPELPPLPEDRKRVAKIAGKKDVYLVDELLPILGDRIAKEFRIERIKPGATEAVTEYAPIRWKEMPITQSGNFLSRVHHAGKIVTDANGVLWLPVQAAYVKPDGMLGSRRTCTHLLRSDDLGHSWDYVSTVVYKEEYNDSNCIDIEGFNEAALEIAEDGSFVMIMRSGSLHPFQIGDDAHPAPKLYMAKSTDRGKTWSIVRPLFDYGVRPMTTKLDCGVRILISGRPGVYIATCDDPACEEWSDMIQIIEVPKEDRYKAYFEYTCCNCGVCAFDANTAFITYSDFQRTTPNGERAKSIMVAKITVE